MAGFSLLIYTIFVSIIISIMDPIVEAITAIVYYETYAYPDGNCTFQRSYDEILICECIKNCDSMSRAWVHHHIMDSWDLIWSSSLIGFLLGIYCFAGSIYVYNTESRLHLNKKD